MPTSAKQLYAGRRKRNCATASSSDRVGEKHSSCEQRWHKNGKQLHPLQVRLVRHSNMQRKSIGKTSNEEDMFVHILSAINPVLPTHQLHLRLELERSPAAGSDPRPHSQGAATMGVSKETCFKTRELGRIFGIHGIHRRIFSQPYGHFTNRH